MRKRKVNAYIYSKIGGGKLVYVRKSKTKPKRSTVARKARQSGGRKSQRRKALHGIKRL